MVSSRIRGLGMASPDRHARIVLFTLIAGSASCAPSVRVPLAVPLPAVGGSRPATPQGLQLIGAFGDGVWGQEQQRAEMAGGGLRLRCGGPFRVQRLGLRLHSRGAERQRQLRLWRTDLRGSRQDSTARFRGGMASIGVHTAVLGSQRWRYDVQDDLLLAWDVALPLEFYPLGGPSPDHRLGLYVAPRFVFQTLEDRARRVTAKGTMAGGLLGLAARWRYVALSGELNFAKTPTMSYVGTTFPGGWLALPMAGVSVIIPLGN